MTAAYAGEIGRGRSGVEVSRPFFSANLDPSDRDALARACGDIRTVSAGTELLRRDAPANALHILLDGWAARYKIMEDGGRFIPALIVPGDICDLDALRFSRLDYGVMMVSAGVVAVLPRERANALFTTNPAVADAFWSLALAENSMMMEWAACVGRRSASQRVAHLLCDLLVRLTVVGKAHGHSYNLPLTQEHMADALGLTNVHVNRTLQSLRSNQLVTVQQRRVTIHNWPALSALCGFRPDYLHLETVDNEFMPELPATGARRRGQFARASISASKPSFPCPPKAA